MRREPHSHEILGRLRADDRDAGQRLPGEPRGSTSRTRPPAPSGSRRRTARSSAARASSQSALGGIEGKGVWLDGAINDAKRDRIEYTTSNQPTQRARGSPGSSSTRASATTACAAAPHVPGRHARLARRALDPRPAQRAQRIGDRAAGRPPPPGKRGATSASCWERLRSTCTSTAIPSPRQLGRDEPRAQRYDGRGGAPAEEQGQPGAPCPTRSAAGSTR